MRWIDGKYFLSIKPHVLINVSLIFQFLLNSLLINC